MGSYARDSATAPSGTFQCEQRAGEALYVPSGWGHSVHNLGETVAIACECTAPEVHLTYDLFLAPFAEKYGFANFGRRGLDFPSEKVAAQAPGKAMEKVEGLYLKGKWKPRELHTRP